MVRPLRFIEATVSLACDIEVCPLFDSLVLVLYAQSLGR